MRLQEGLANQRCRPCRPDRRIAVGLFCVVFVAYAWFFGGGGWNQNAHFDLTRALVERQTFHIDGYRVNTGDISWSREAHAYSNKPPGLPFLAAIPYALLMTIERAMHVSLDSWLVMTINVYVLTLVVVAIPGALIPVVLFSYLRRRGVSSRAAVCTALVTAFATIVFPYSTVFYSVVPAAFFLLLAFVWLEGGRPARPGRTGRPPSCDDERPLLAGVAAGIAGMCFYFCIPAAAVFAIGTFVHSRRNALRFILGGLPFGILLAVYHTVCFGAPWRATFAGKSGHTREGLILGLFRAPSWDAFHGITFSEYRGLFFVSPVLLLAFAGAFFMIRRRVMLRELAMIGAVVAMFVLIVSSFAAGWEGGLAFGPRHILPMIPLLAIPLAFVRWQWLVLLLAIPSFAMQFVAASVNVQPPGNVFHPVRAYLVPIFLTGNIPPDTLKTMGESDAHVGKVSINRQAVDELIPHFVHPRGSHESTWASFNLGELIFGPTRRSSVIPIALWILSGSLLLIRQSQP
ncbi:MAG TPA: hypothetical protein VNA69_22600 [Thermoanaerobaculia bacterium]|nr:hypothetical protein [Thermoanaerobaculia bacterium]